MQHPNDSQQQPNQQGEDEAQRSNNPVDPAAALFQPHARSRLALLTQRALLDQQASNHQSISTTGALHAAAAMPSYQDSISLIRALHQHQQHQSGASLGAQLLAQRQQQQLVTDNSLSLSLQQHVSAARVQELNLQAAMLAQLSNSTIGVVGGGATASGLNASLGMSAGASLSPAGLMMTMANQQQHHQPQPPMHSPSALYPSSRPPGSIEPFLLDAKQAPESGAKAKRVQDDTAGADEKKAAAAVPKRKRRRLTVKGNSFLLPAIKASSKPPTVPITTATAGISKLQSYSKMWNQLGDSKMREEIFRRRLHQGRIPLTGKTKSPIVMARKQKRKQRSKKEAPVVSRV